LSNPQFPHHHGHSHAERGAPVLRLSWLRQSLVQRLAGVAMLLVPLWLAVVWAIK
jgi:hypothetical protein